jgi:hypothetical protein
LLPIAISLAIGGLFYFITWNAGKAYLNTEYRKWVNSPEIQNDIKLLKDRFERTKQWMESGHGSFSECVNAGINLTNYLASLEQSWNNKNQTAVFLFRYIIPITVLCLPLLVTLVRHRKNIRIPNRRMKTPGRGVGMFLAVVFAVTEFGVLLFTGYIGDKLEGKGPLSYNFDVYLFWCVTACLACLSIYLFVVRFRTGGFVEYSIYTLAPAFALMQYLYESLPEGTLSGRSFLYSMAIICLMSGLIGVYIRKTSGKDAANIVTTT